uniref:DUF559 domain-containing protein n=1 Tax=viral metagenome TaxID=1070528 RepID=A0A6M3LTN9_9ZZZZ
MRMASKSMIIKSGKEIGKLPQYHYIWQPCKYCGIERWVIIENGKPRSIMCRTCASGLGADACRGKIQSPELVEKRRQSLLDKGRKLKAFCANCGQELVRANLRIKKGNVYCNGKCQMEYEYKNGIRDPHETTEKAHIATRELVNNGNHPFQNPENIIRGQKACGSKNYGKTWLEEKMGWALNKLGVQFESQYPVKYGVDILNRNRYYFPDFAIPESNLLIECDGSYWHKNKKRENLRESRLKELGWNIIRFSDTEIKSDLMGCADRVRTWLPVV